jgi:hypothetical protein
VIWTDESSFELGECSRTIRVWRRAEEKYHSDCLAPSFKSGRTSVMAWGGRDRSVQVALAMIPSGERTAADFVRIVYDGVLGHYWQHHRNPQGSILMEGGAPTHRAHLSTQWLRNVGLPKLKWPANSPDLNPIEHLGSMCKCHIDAHERPPNQPKLIELIERVWDGIPQDAIASLIASVPARIQAVIEAGGMHTRW